MAHERIACGCFVYLWGMAVLWEDAGGVSMCSVDCRLLVNVVGCVMSRSVLDLRLVWSLDLLGPLFVQWISSVFEDGSEL